MVVKVEFRFSFYYKKYLFVFYGCHVFLRLQVFMFKIDQLFTVDSLDYVVSVFYEIKNVTFNYF
jgi:hypothetical protein